MSPNRAYLREVVEVCHIFYKIMEHFCKDGVVVQKKQQNRKRGRGKKSKGNSTEKQPTQVCLQCLVNTFNSVFKKNNLFQDELENTWATLAGQISEVLVAELTLPEDQHPLPYDAVSDVPMDEQK